MITPLPQNAAELARRAPIPNPNWRFGVYGVGETRLSYNALVFSTEDEAYRAGLELQMRWFGMSGFEVVETDEPVNYIFPQIAFRPYSKG